jgi:hypothetical protein
MPLLLRGLTLPDPMLRAGVIDTLLSAAQADVEAETKTAKDGNVVSEHAVSLTNAMLQNSAVAEMPDMVRASFRFPFRLLSSFLLGTEGTTWCAQVPRGASEDCAV